MLFQRICNNGGSFVEAACQHACLISPVISGLGATDQALNLISLISMNINNIYLMLLAMYSRAGLDEWESSDSIGFVLTREG